MTWQIWAITIGGILAMFAVAGLGPALLASASKRRRAATHRRPPGLVEDQADEFAGRVAGYIPRAQVAGAPPWNVIEGPWPRLDGCSCQAIAGSHKPPCQWALQVVEDLPAPELLDDLPPVDWRADRATIRVHRSAELVEDQAAELPPGHVQRPDTDDGASYCEPCEERCTPAQPCVCCWLADLSEDVVPLVEDQAPDLDVWPAPEALAAAMAIDRIRDRFDTIRARFQS